MTVAFGGVPLRAFFVFLLALYLDPKFLRTVFKFYIHGTDRSSFLLKLGRMLFSLWGPGGPHTVAP